MISCELELNTPYDVWCAITGEVPTATDIEGDIELVEYEISDGTWLQVVFDHSRHHDPIDWCVTTQRENWMIG